MDKGAAAEAEDWLSLQLAEVSRSRLWTLATPAGSCAPLSYSGWLVVSTARQVEILQSIYPDEVTVQEQRAVSSDAALPLFEVIVGKSPSVCVTLQRGYPTHGSLGLRWREGGGLSNKQKEEVLSRVQRVCEGQEGGERLLAVVQEFYEALADCDEAPADHESCPKSVSEACQRHRCESPRLIRSARGLRVLMHDKRTGRREA